MSKRDLHWDGWEHDFWCCEVEGWSLFFAFLTITDTHDIFCFVQFSLHGLSRRFVLRGDDIGQFLRQADLLSTSASFFPLSLLSAVV